MPIEATLDYFNLAYNKKNQKTAVTNLKTTSATLGEYFVISVGQPNSDATANVNSDLITIINKIKPDQVVLGQERTKVREFCEQIGVTYSVIERNSVPAALDFESPDEEDDQEDDQEDDEYAEFLPLDENEDEDGE